MCNFFRLFILPSVDPYLCPARYEYDIYKLFERISPNFAIVVHFGRKYELIRSWVQ